MPSTRLFLSAVLVALIGVLAPVAGATPNKPSPHATQTPSYGPPQMVPLQGGNLWRGGQLMNATMYAQVGKTAMAQITAPKLPRTMRLVGLVQVSTYICDDNTQKVAPSVRAESTPFASPTCALLTEEATGSGRKIGIAVPVDAVGSYLSIEQTAIVNNGVANSSLTRWVEVPVYPTNPVSLGAAVPNSPVYAGAPIAFTPRPWAIAPFTSLVSRTMQAWVCPSQKVNSSTKELSQLGCNRVFNNPQAQVTSQQFTLSGTIHRELVVDQQLVYVSYVTVDPVGLLPARTYGVRSQSIRIQNIPAPVTNYDVSNEMITASFTPIAGVTYKISATRVGGQRQFVSKCEINGTQGSCTLDIIPGQWRTTIIPIGLNATGNMKKTVLTVPDQPNM